MDAGKLPPVITDSAVYFFGYETGHPEDCFQQWFPSHFTDPAMDGNPSFPTAEHYMMHCKARLMNDHETATNILHCKTPAEAKTYGRQVRNFNQTLWDAACDAVVQRGNLLKFSQNAELGKILLATGDREIVEASPNDRVRLLADLNLQLIMLTDLGHWL